MSVINIIAVAPVANATDLNSVLEAMGYGPGNLSTKASTTPDQAFGAASTHLFMSMQAATMEFQADLLGYSGGGDLPPLPDGVVWGENGVISAAAAMAAAPYLGVASFSSDWLPDDQVAATLGAAGLYRHLPPADV